MKKVYLVLLIFSYFISNGQISYFGNNQVPTSSGITSLSAGITAKFAHWESAKDMTPLSDGTAIDSIPDLTSNNRKLSNTGTARPLYYSTRCNGYPSWYFDGTNDCFNIPTYTTRGACMVVNVDSTRTSFPILEGLYGSRSTASPNSYWGTDGAFALLDFSPSGNVGTINTYASTGRNFFLPAGNIFKVVCFTTTTGVTDANGWQIMSDRKYGTRFWKGNCSEVIGFSTIPTKKELDTINSYLWTKYNLTTPINFIQDGNSIGVGVGAYVRDSIGICAYRNFSAGGQTTLQRFFAAPTAVDTCYGFPYGNKQVVYLLEGTNDLVTNANVDTCYEHFIRYINARKAAGWKVVVSTILSRDTTINPGVGYEAKRQALNTLLTSMAQDNTFKVVDFGQDANLGSTLAYQNLTYFSDGIHPTATGYKLIAKYVANVIKSFTW